MVVPVLLLTIGAAAVLIGTRRRWPRQVLVDAASQGSPVAFQHLQLFQGGGINQVALDSARSELEEKLSHGETEAVETSLRPGLDFIVKVRALTEIGTTEAGVVLERQLKRLHTDDPIEQSWYWYDLAQALRELNREQSLPALLRCGEQAIATPLGHLYAAEVCSFMQFGEYLNDPLSSGGQKALQLLRAALEGIRRGFVPVTLLADAQIGEIIQKLAEMCPDTADALLARLFIEAMRHVRRSHSSYPELKDDPMRRQAVRWQAGLLREAEPIFREYLHGIGEDLCDQLPRCGGKDQVNILAVLADLHTDSGKGLVDLLDQESYRVRSPAIECLQWSTAPEAAACLRQLARTKSTARDATFTWWKRKQSSDTELSPDLLAALKALRGHPSVETERLLLKFVQHSQSTLRVAALRSLGWKEPIQRTACLQALQAARMENDAETRMAAIGALARLGEIAALQVLRDSLAAGQPEVVHHAIDIIAQEGLTWLWPDLDLLTEHDDAAIAHHAWEAVEELRESILGPLA